MPGTQTVSGIVSGMDTATVIQQLLELQRAPVYRLEAKKQLATQRIAAWQALNAALLGLKVSSYALARTPLYQAKSVSVSDSDVLTATATTAAQAGFYSLRVAQLARAHQLTSTGYRNAHQELVGSGTLTFEVGAGRVDSDTPLTSLNGGAGAARGSIKITDRAGDSAVIDLSAAATVGEAADLISAAQGIDVTATVEGDHLVVTYDGSGSSSNLKVEEVGSGTTASDLGILNATGVASSSLTGSNIKTISTSTRLEALNDGNGVDVGCRTTLVATVVAGATTATLSSVEGLSVSDTVKISDGTNTDYVVLTDVNYVQGTISWDGGSHNLDSTYTWEDTTVSRVDMRVVDSSGMYFVDLSDAETVGDVIDAINAAENESGGNANISAAINDEGNGLVLQHATGDAMFTASANSDHTAVSDLGFDVDVTLEQSNTMLYGKRVVAGLTSVLLSRINAPGDGTRGVASGSVSVTDRDGNSVTLNLSTRVHAALSADITGDKTSAIVDDISGFAIGNRFRIGSGGSFEYRTVTGIDSATNTITWDEGLSGTYTSGMTITAMTETVEDVLNHFANAGSVAGVSVDLSTTLNASGNGIRITDNSGGSGNFTIAESGGTTGADLGILVDDAVDYVDSGDMDHQYISESTLVTALNGGQGVRRGSIQITDSNGNSATVSLTASDIYTIGDIIDRINRTLAGQTTPVQATARINDTGDGIVIVDDAGGEGSLTVAEVAGGSTASGLNILGSSAAGEVDGAFEWSVSVQANDTLNDVVDAINDEIGLPVQAAVINDGISERPYRLVLTSQLSGLRGRMVVSDGLTGGTGLSFNESSEAADAHVLVGSDSGGNALLVSSSTNVVRNAVSGVTLTLKQVDSSPVEIAVTEDYDTMAETVSGFVNNFNSVVAMVNAYSDYDAESEEAGILQGNVSLMSLRQQLFSMIVNQVDGLPSEMSLLSQVGITMSFDGTIQLNESELLEALEENLTGVRDLFLHQQNVALVSEGSTATASTTYTGFDPADAVNGDTDSDNWGPGTNGWRNNTAKDQWFQVQFSDQVDLAKVVVYTLDSTQFPAEDYGIAGYDLEYYDPDAGSTEEERWVGLWSVYANTSGRVTHNIPSGIKTTAIRLTNFGSNGGFYPLIEVEAYENRGTGATMNELLGFITDSVDGTLTQVTDSLEDEVLEYDDDIAHWEEILAGREERLLREFTEMERVLGEMQTQSTWLTNQIAGINANWVLN